jgi:hypothetical protein
LIKVGQPSIGKLHQRAAGCALRYAEPLPEADEVVGVELGSTAPPMDMAIVVSPYRCVHGTS